LCRTESHRRYNRSKQGRAAAKKWSQTEKGRAKTARRRLSPAFRKSRDRYNQSEKGKQAQRRRTIRAVRVRIGGEIVRVLTARTAEEATQIRAFVIQQLRIFRQQQKERQNVFGTIRTTGKETSSVSSSADSTETELRKD
jgi:hypothetical protein